MSRPPSGIANVSLGAASSIIVVPSFLIVRASSNQLTHDHQVTPQPLARSRVFMNRIIRWRRPLTARQRRFEFLERSLRRQRRFKLGILLATALIMGLILLMVPRGRYLAAALGSRARQAGRQALGLPTPRAEIDAGWERFRLQGLAESRRALVDVYNQAEPAYQKLMRYAGLDPEHGLLRWGNFDRTLLLPSTVFESDDTGRSYRFRACTDSIWVRNITIKSGVLMFFQVPDGPGLAEAIRGTGGVPVETSRQTTNSWGLRGLEPDLTAPYRGIVLGDSYMQGMFIGDHETPPECLRRFLEKQLGDKVSILNTGHLGYSCEQYYYSLEAFLGRFRPNFVVVSVFANDFGDIWEVLKGKGDWNEGKYWLDKITDLCRARDLPHLFVPIPFEPQMLGRRRAGFYPGTISNILEVNSLMLLDPTDEFINAHLELLLAGERVGRRPTGCPLFNIEIADGHFSGLGSEVWASSVGAQADPPLRAEPIPDSGFVSPRGSAAAELIRGGCRRGPFALLDRFHAGLPRRGETGSIGRSKPCHDVARGAGFRARGSKMIGPSSRGATRAESTGRGWTHLSLRARRLRRRRQSEFEFVERAGRLERVFKTVIALMTVGLLAVLLLALPTGRYLAQWLTTRGWWLARAAVGLEPPRAEIDVDWRRKRLFDIQQASGKLAGTYREYTPAQQSLLRFAGLDADHALVRTGNFDRTVLLPSTIFIPDETGRSYRFRPNLRSIWVRNFPMKGQMKAYFQILDQPGIADIVEGTGASIVEGSIQTTNSWGLRGPEPNLASPWRGIVLGDSYMQGLFVADDETPTECLKRDLRSRLDNSVEILNTGHLGYSPEQYYYTMVEYYAQFPAQFVVVSIFANDFGDFQNVLHGKGDWGEGRYWLGRIHQFCQARGISHLVVPAPWINQIENPRMAGFYPGQVSNILESTGFEYLDPADAFANAQLELSNKARARGAR